VIKIDESIPAFASEQEEADWFDAHAEERDGRFAEAAANGTLMNREQFREMMLREHNVSWFDARVSVSISDDDLACAKAMAKTSGLSAEEYLGQVVHEALRAKRAA